MDGYTQTLAFDVDGADVVLESFSGVGADVRDSYDWAFETKGKS